MAVQRIYVEKRPEHAVEAKGLLAEFRGLLGVKGLTGLRILNRYDVEGMAPEQFRQAVPVVFSEPQLDEVYPAIPQGEFTVFATEYLPGQFDQRAASAAECVGLLFGGERPAVATARVFLLSGSVSEAELAAIKKYVINPVAPPQPSRPVRPPRRITTSPGAGCSRRTFSSGTAPSTAPISMRFAT